MKERPHMDPSEITQKHVDIQKVLANKNVKLPKFAVRWVERLMHIDEVNYVIYNHRTQFGLDFVHAFLEGNEPHDLNIQVEVIGKENIPLDGNPIIAGNHPLGGPDGLALLGAVGHYRTDLIFPVTDFLMYLPGPAPLFVPVDKVHHNSAYAHALEEAFADDNTMLIFPSGLCSRKQNGIIRDLEWKPTFVKKAVKYQRDIVPFYFDARARNSFYNIANIRKRLGIKFGFEMALLPAEMFAQRGKHLRLTIGKPIPYSTFDSRHTPAQWAALLREHTYRLAEDPNALFEG